MIECITSLIVANPLIAEFIEKTPEGLRHRQNGLIIAIDIARFGDPEAFRREVDRLSEWVRQLLTYADQQPAAVIVLLPFISPARPARRDWTLARRGKRKGEARRKVSRQF